MKIHILSDTHLEFSTFVPPLEDADVVVLAGDIGKHTHGFAWALETFYESRHAGRRPAIIYIPGNHEFYDAELHGIRQQLQQAAALARENGIRAWVLDNGSIEIDGVRFLGSTLWTDYQLFGTGAEMAYAMRDAERFLQDHRVIRCSPQPRFSTSQALALHLESAAWLSSELAKPHTGKAVVVTHHLPSALSVAERFKSAPLSAAFASNLDHLVERADLWIHGHTHDNFDYQVGRCRVVCNPRGYVREHHGSSRQSVENQEFNPGLVVEI
ncbi:MAG: metallophosphoesterase [Rhodocyclaceae bacterium]|nr:MAG: metallophosphoesterase [Rhodocyclaceae bacterium]